MFLVCWGIATLRFTFDIVWILCQAFACAVVNGTFYVPLRGVTKSILRDDFVALFGGEWSRSDPSPPYNSRGNFFEITITLGKNPPDWASGLFLGTGNGYYIGVSSFVFHLVFLSS